jgi:hypothetical protein
MQQSTTSQPSPQTPPVPVVTPTVRVTPSGSLCLKTGVKVGLGFSGIFFGGYYYH